MAAIELSAAALTFAVLLSFAAGGGMIALLLGRKPAPAAAVAERAAETKPAAPRRARVAPSGVKAAIGSQTGRILEALQEGVIGLDTQGRAEFVNPAATNILGWTTRDLLGVRFHDLVMHTQEDGEPFEYATSPVSKTLTTGEVAERMATTLWTKSRAPVQAELSVSATRENGQVTGAVLVFRDVSERARLEAEAKHARAHLEEAQSIAKIGSWEFDVKTGNVYWSDELYRMYGFEVGSPVDYARFMEGVHPEDRDRMAATVKQASETREPYVIEHRVQRPDGTVRWLRGRGRVVLEGDEVSVMVGTAQDITADYELEAAAAASASMFRAVADAVPEYVSLLDEEGRFLYNNRLFEAFQPEDVVGKFAWDFTPESNRKDWQDLILNTLKGKEPVQTRMMGADGEGNPREWDVDLRPVPENGGCVMIARMRD